MTTPAGRAPKRRAKTKPKAAVKPKPRGVKAKPKPAAKPRPAAPGAGAAKAKPRRVSRAAAATAPPAPPAPPAAPRATPPAAQRATPPAPSAAPAAPAARRAPPDPAVAAAIGLLVRGECATPFDVLGPHALDDRTTVVRTFQPGAREVVLDSRDALIAMVRIHDEGVFEAVVPSPAPRADYRFRVRTAGGPEVVRDDPYRFDPWLSEFDLHLFGEGTHEHLNRKMGAQLAVHQGVEGVNFAVWAPNAVRVSLIGDLNRWDARAHPMRRRGSTGVWELFVPGLGAGALYKFDILTRLGGRSTVKADPYGVAMELRPNTASVVYDLGRYRWGDADWMAARPERQRSDRPLAIYEVHPGSWKRHGGEAPDWLSWRELADDLVPYVKRMGFTHIELLPVTEHPFDGSWGYQTVGYFAPTSRFGPPDDFRHFVDTAHQAGLGVILDWVPAHFPKDAHGLGFFDGTHLYEHADPRRGEHRDWGTLIFNLTRPQVSGLLLASALHWLQEFHVDGLRVDAVASMLYLDYSREPGEWVPNPAGGRENIEAIKFLMRFNTLVHARVPGVLTFAEESTSWPRVTGPVDQGGLGFDLKWNMGWMNDTLSYMATDPLGRAHQHDRLTFSLHYAWRERFLLPLSHDEVVHGKRSLLFKMPGDAWKKFANLRALFGWMYAHPGKKLVFMGGEIGQVGEWNFERQVTWALLDEPLHAGLQAYVAEVNRIYGAEPALHQVDDHWDGFQWIDFQDAAHSVISCVRRARDPGDRLVIVASFTPVPREGYRVRMPGGGRWIELLNSDDERWGGSGVGQPEGVEAAAAAEGVRDGLTHEVTLRLPPLGVLWLKPAG